MSGDPLFGVSTGPSAAGRAVGGGLARINGGDGVGQESLAWVCDDAGSALRHGQAASDALEAGSCFRHRVDSARSVPTPFRTRIRCQHVMRECLRTPSRLERTSSGGWVWCDSRRYLPLVRLSLETYPSTDVSVEEHILWSPCEAEAALAADTKEKVPTRVPDDLLRPLTC